MNGLPTEKAQREAEAAKKQKRLLHSGRSPVKYLKINIFSISRNFRPERTDGRPKAYGRTAKNKTEAQRSGFGFERRDRCNGVDGVFFAAGKKRRRNRVKSVPTWSE